MFTSLGLAFLFLFLPFFCLAYWVIKQEYRPHLLIVASVVFISWGQGLAFVSLCGLLAITYHAALLIERYKAAQRGRALGFLLVGLGVTVGLLVLFKALSAGWLFRVAQLFNQPDPLENRAAGLVAFVGVSYIVLQLVGYLLDVWQGRQAAEKNFINLAGYVFFFPKLVSGPLIRYSQFVTQFQTLSPTTEQAALGFRRLLWGFIKRALIAGTLAKVADAAFNLPTANLPPLWAWLGLGAYALQIYYDFAGYSDMAIGLGLLVGLRLPENFNAPYLAQSVSDFWRRWHISLSTWFREYVFYPLERHRLPWLGQQINILIVFLLTGLWHGFQFTFVAWGLLHGLALAVESLGWGRWLKKLWQPLQHLYTLVIVLAGWVFFRAESLDAAFGFFGHLAGNTANLALQPYTVTAPLPFIDPSFVVVMVVAGLCILPLGAWAQGLLARGQQTRLAFGWQVAQDFALMALFTLGVAAVVSSTFLPNLYAKF